MTNNNDPKKEIDKLKQDLNTLNKVFESQVREIQERLQTLESSINTEDNQKEALIQNNKESIEEVQNIAAIGAASTLAAKETANKPEEDPKSENITVPEPDIQHQKKSEPKEPKKPIFARLLAAMVAIPILGPVASILERLGNIYKEFEEQGKLPVFFLTTAGILASVAGAGFILQYSFVNYFGPMAKIISGFLFALSIIILGMWLIRKNEAYREFGSSIIGLGIIIVYLCIYFGASFYSIFPPIPGFILILINTLGAYILALKYETKVVSAISFLGGAFAPFFLGLSGQFSIFYSIFLLLLCISALHLARVIKWQTMVYLSFVTAAGIIEWSVFVFESPFDIYIHVMLLHGFTYIYIYSSLFSRFSLKENLTKTDIMVLSGTLFLLIINLFTILQNQEFNGYLLLGNAVIFLIPAFLPALSKKNNVRASLFLMAGILIALAIPLIFSFGFMALFWFPEAIALLYLGCLFKINSVRNEGYILLGVAVIQGILNSQTVAHNWGNSFFHMGTLNLFLVGIALIVSYFLLKKNTELLQNYEKSILKFIDESFSLWGLAFFLLAAFFYIPEYAMGLSLIPMILLFFKAVKQDLKFTKFLGFVCYSFILIQIVVSAVIFIQSYEILGSLSPLQLLLHQGIIHLLLIGVLLTIINILLEKIKSLQKPAYKGVVSFNHELFSLWALSTFMIAVFHFVPSFAFGLALIPLPILFLRGDRKNLPFTVILGFICYLLILAQAWVSITEVNSYHFSDQTVYGKAAIAIAYLLLWVMELYYEKIMPENLLVPFFKKARILFYLILPFIYLSHISRHYPDYLPLALWGSCMIALTLYEILKIKIINIELKIITTLFSIGGLLFLIVQTDLQVMSPKYLQIPIGFLFFLILLLWKGGFKKDSHKNESYGYLFTLSFIYFGLIVFTLFLKITDSIYTAIVAIGIYSLIMTALRKVVAPVDPFYNYYYRMGQTLLGVTFLVSLFKLMDGATFNHSTHTIPYIVALTILGWITISNKEFYDEKGNKKSIFLYIDHYIFHLAAVAIYLMIIYGITGTWSGPFTTVLIVIHSITILFYSILKVNRQLLPLYISGFAVSGLKIFFYDLRGFSIFEKIIVFTIIGVIFLAAAFAMQRFLVKSEKENGK